VNNNERVEAIERWGRFTRRQSAFVVAAELHGGVCLQPQHDKFAGIQNGKATRRFFAALVKRGNKRATPRPRSKTRELSKEVGPPAVARRVLEG
jgi:hypothetical protein